MKRARRAKAKPSLKRAKTKSKTKKAKSAKRPATRRTTTSGKRTGSTRKALLPKFKQVAKKATLAAGVAAIGTALSELKPEQDQKGAEASEPRDFNARRLVGTYGTIVV